LRRSKGLPPGVRCPSLYPVGSSRRSQLSLLMIVAPLLSPFPVFFFFFACNFRRVQFLFHPLFSPPFQGVEINCRGFSLLGLAFFLCPFINIFFPFLASRPLCFWKASSLSGSLKIFGPLCSPLSFYASGFWLSTRWKRSPPSFWFHFVLRYRGRLSFFLQVGPVSRSSPPFRDNRPPSTGDPFFFSLPWVNVRFGAQSPQWTRFGTKF